MPSESAPQPTPASTFLLLSGLAASLLLMQGDSPSALAKSAALGIGLSLTLSMVGELFGNIRNLVRADVMALAALYFLTVFEFLFPQHDFDELVGIDEARTALTLCHLAFAGIGLGRHFTPALSPRLKKTLKSEFPTSLLVTLFCLALVGGYFYQLAAVNFSVGDWFNYMMSPRFSQPWGRGRLGDWKALVGELGMIVNLVPPIGGIIFARRREYSRNVLILVSLGVGLTFFSGFAGGTRNVLATYLATFTVAYAFSLNKKNKRELFVVGGISAAVMLAATVVMLEFRNIGFLNYLDGYRNEDYAEERSTVFVDYNLYVIAKLTEVFPEKHPYLGMEIPYLAVIRPIPRAIWPGKPEGMSMGIEEALGAEGLTLASTFIGEAYISGGSFGVFATALVFGIILGWWNRLGSPDNSPFGHLVFASGFFAAVISMRSMLVFTTAILPTIAAIMLGTWLLRRQPVRRLLHFPDEPAEASDHDESTN